MLMGWLELPAGAAAAAESESGTVPHPGRPGGTRTPARGLAVTETVTVNPPPASLSVTQARLPCRAVPA